MAPGGSSWGAASNGIVTALSRPDTSAVLNVDEYATVESSGARWGFPRKEGQSLSYWLQQARSDRLLNHRTTAELPSVADCVVIGSGITGTLAAKTLKETRPGKSVVVIEARDFCSGATGRNAGHCKPDTWRGFGKYEQQFGSEQALKIIQNEIDTWKALTGYVGEHSVDCDLWTGDTLDVAMTSELSNLTHDIYNRFKRAGGNVDCVVATTDPAEAAKITRLKGAQACYAWPASTLQPRKLTGHIMAENLHLGVNLQTFTPVRIVSRSQDERYRWCVETDRGKIDCLDVVHASNAYMSAYEPSFRGLIIPKPHICSKVIPPLSFSGSKALNNSYGILLPNGAYHTINSRCNSDGVLMFGGQSPGQRELDSWVDQHPQYCIDDGMANVKGVTASVRSLAESHFDGWQDGRAVGPGQGYDYSWSGIIGLAKDNVPFVGELPGKEGQWVCAGHNGHGMARTFTAAPAVVKLMNGEAWEDTGLPDVYRLTQERMQSLRTALGSTNAHVADLNRTRVDSTQV